MTNLRAFDKRRTTTQRSYEPKQLNARHHEILRLNMLGYTNVQIAERLSCTPATVSTALNSSLGKEQASILRAEADYSAVETAKRIRELAPRALALVAEIVDDTESPKALRLRAAQDILDRGGYVPPKNVNMTSTQITLSGTDLEELKAQALQRARLNDIVIDISPIEEGEHE